MKKNAFFRFSKSRCIGALLLGGLLGIAWGCSGTKEARKDAGWTKSALSLTPDAALENAASVLCSRDTDAVVGDDVRRVAGLSDGVVMGVMASDDESMSEQVRVLSAQFNLTHMGKVKLARPSGKLCSAAVLSRREMTPKSELATTLAAPQSVTYRFSASEDLSKSGAPLQLFVQLPNGIVKKRLLGKAQDEISFVADYQSRGRHRLEVLALTPDEGPQVVALFAVDIDTALFSPPPEVLFADTGHDDTALTRRTEALVHRLRNELALPWMRVAPALASVAKTRARSIASEQKLGHLLPDDKDALASLKMQFPAFKVARLAEVQAQASTLQDAWTALLTSPAHRYELTLAQVSHIGAQVVRGKDALGRDQISVVVLLARQISTISVKRAKGGLFQKFNLARTQTSVDSDATATEEEAKKMRDPLKWDKKLAALAQGCAANLARQKSVIENPNAPTITVSSLAQLPNYSVVRSVLADADDPMRIGLSAAVLDEELTHIGIGLVRDEKWYACVLTAY